MTLIVCCDTTGFKWFFHERWPVYLHLSFPPWWTATTAPAVQSATQMSWFLFSVHYTISWVQRLNLTIKLNRLFLRRPLETDTLDWVLSSLYIVTRRSLVDVTHSWLGVHPCNLINSVVCLLFILFTVFVCNSEYNRFPSLSTAISKANLL